MTWSVPLWAEKIVHAFFKTIAAVLLVASALLAAWGTIIWLGGDVRAHDQGWGLPEQRKIIYGLPKPGGFEEMIRRGGWPGGDVVYDDSHTWVLVFHFPEVIYQWIPSNPLAFRDIKSEWPGILLDNLLWVFFGP